MDPRLAAATLRQPDATTCGAAVLVMARSISDPGYAELLATGLHPLTGYRLPGAIQERFAAEALAMHRRTTSSVDVRGAAQLPWPQKYGTPPWAVARQLSGSTGTPWQAKAISPWGRSGALKEIRSAAARQAVPLFVGSRWIPRHVVLVLDAGLRVYEPSSGRVVTITADDFVQARLSLAGWSNPWFSVLPARRTRA